MPRAANDVNYRSDRVLFAALAIILATASAAVGSAMTYRANPLPVTAMPAPVRQQDMILAALVDEHRCLAEALYYEARGEGKMGQQAVAEVVMRRREMGRYGNSICAVVYEGAAEHQAPGHHGCQFSFTCDGSLHRPRDVNAWQESEVLAAQILTGAVRLRNATQGATNYHAVWVSPDWAPTLKRTAQIGNHIFYRGLPHSRES
jgi:spore germination cell wall hydrolase CwlJ-like protein